MRKDLIFALLVLVALVMPAVADEVDDLIADLNDTDNDAKKEAIMALYMVGDARAVEPLIEILISDGDTIVRVDSALALGEIGDPRAIDPLIEILNTDEEERVRKYAAGALSEFDDPRVCDALIKAFDNESSDYVKGFIVRDLGHLGDLRAVDFLINILNGDGGDRRASAAQSLGEIGDPKAIDPLLDVVQNDPYQYARKYAVKSLMQNFGLSELECYGRTEPCIFIKRGSALCYQSIGMGSVSGMYYRAVELSIDNCGYDRFYVPEFSYYDNRFWINIENVEYYEEYVPDNSILPRLGPVTLRDGGKIKGKVAFLLPSSILHDAEYTIECEPWWTKSYNIVYGEILD